MLTKKLHRAETRSIAIAAPPAAVLGLVGDALRLPDWAPGFARAVRPDGGRWTVDTGEGEISILVRVSPEHGTVDLLAADAPTVGAFTRVLPNRDGSEYQFTLLFPEDAAPAAVEAQMHTVEEELRTVRALCEADVPLAA
jgi:hypothetical protein